MRLEISTKEKLLTVAGALFAEKGFQATTIREICDKANTNVASINYHFKDKLGLYGEVLKFGLEIALKKYPPQMGLDQAAVPAEKLHAFIRSFLFRTLDKGEYSWHGKLMALEMVHPTKALDDLIETTFKPMTKILEAIINDAANKVLTKDQTRKIAMSIIGQCLFYMHSKYVINRIYPEQEYDAESLEDIAGHVTHFSLSAIKNIDGTSTGGQ